MLRVSSPMTVEVFLTAASECLEAIEAHRSAAVLIGDSLVRPLRMEQHRLREAIESGIALVEESLTTCLAVPALSPWVNTAGVASMLRSAQKMFCDAADHKCLTQIDELLKRDHATASQFELDVQLTRESSGAIEKVVTALRACVVAACSSEGDLYKPVLECRDALEAVRRDHPTGIDQVPLSSIEEAFAQQLVRILSVVSTASSEMERLVAEATSELTEWFSAAQHKEKELEDLHQWYMCCVSACEEWLREDHRREVSQAALAQRVAHLQKELDLLVDEENLERLEFDRRCGKFLPRAGFPRVFEAVPPLVIRPVTSDFNTRR